MRSLPTQVRCLPFRPGAKVPWPDGSRGRRRYFTLDEQARAREKLAKKTRSEWCGMTFEALRRMFRADIFHQMGVGFFYYPDQPRAAADPRGK
jgi:hypothetical protein